MLARYSMVRGKKSADMPRRLREGVRVDTRKHTKHCLRPPEAAVSEYLADPSDDAFERFRAAYLEAVEARFAHDPAEFAALAERARNEDVFLGCSCPTAKNPDVRRCHTALALERDSYPLPIWLL